MADDNAGSRGGSVRTVTDMERLARRIARDEIEDLLRRLGIDAEKPEQWHSFFGETNPIQAREAVRVSLARKEAQAALEKTLRSSVSQWLIGGVLVALANGILLWLKK